MGDDISLLWPRGYRDRGAVKKIAVNTMEDLQIEKLCMLITEKETEKKLIQELLSTLCMDEEVIKYRQKIFWDIYHSERLSKFFNGLFDKLDYISMTSHQVKAMEEEGIWMFFLRLKELNAYRDCVLEIKRALETEENAEELKSDGLMVLKQKVMEISDEREFRQLCVDLDQVNEKTGSIRSMKLGVNLDASFYPSDLTLLSFGTHRIEHTEFLNNLIDTNDRGSQMTPIRKTAPNTRHSLMTFIHQDIDDALSLMLREMKGVLGKYSSIDGTVFNNIVPELLFYVRFSKMYQTISNNQMPVVIPEVTPVADNFISITQFYNLYLALHRIEQNKCLNTLILNEVHFDDKGRVLLLTGPNMGGKTVYTTGIGMAQILFQAGLPIPGETASMSPVDQILTHYPVEEDQTGDLGRLGEECKRLREIFELASENSLLLLNETLSSTSFSEGMQLAEETVLALRYLGSRALYNTHMHELASTENILRYHTQQEGKGRIVSLVTGVEAGVRSYKIYEGPPIGKSFAIDIANKHGLNLQKLIEAEDKMGSNGGEKL